MAKAQPKENQSALVKSESEQDGLSHINAKEAAGVIIGTFSNVDESELVSITEDYLKFEEDTTYNMVFVNTTKFTGDRGGEMDAVSLIDEEGKKWINAGTVLVNSLKKVTQLPCLIRIVTKGTIKSKNGQYLDMDVFVLPKTMQK